MKHAQKNELSDEISLIEESINLDKLQIASTLVNRTLKTYPNNPSILALKGVTVLLQGNSSKADELFSRASNLSPNSLFHYLHRGLINKNNNHFDTAKHALLQYLAANPNSVTAQASIAECFSQLGDKASQFITLMRLAGVTTLSESQLNKFFELSPQLSVTSYSEPMINGLKQILKQDAIDALALSNNIGNYLLSRYRLDKAQAKLDLNTLAHDQLLLEALPRIRLCHPHLEHIFTTVREALLVVFINNKGLDPSFLPLARAIALQNHLNEYVYFIKEEEHELIQKVMTALNHQINKPTWNPHESSEHLLLIGMYQGLHQTQCAEKLLKVPARKWSPIVQELVETTLIDIEQELEHRGKIKSITEISDPTSQLVKSQYEENPYPRWVTAKVGKLQNLASLILQFAPQVKSLPKQLFDASTPVLIAGCGTGQQAAATALRLPQAKITAIDISLRSLAYAEIQCRKLNIKNIDFFQGDILSLPKGLGPFHYIECCGVLHHMENPLAGWQRLLDLLAPGGFMKIALYSSTARREITLEREKIKSLGIQATPDQIRAYRRSLLQSTPPSKIPELFMDFYSLSDCRDLLFHHQEVCFDWDTIQDYCKTLGVKFLGIFDHTGIWKQYLKDFPNYTHSASFENLKKLESNHPLIFRSMYQFLVQKPIH